MTEQLGSQIITIHVSANISQSIGNQLMKFGQATEYNKANIFLQKSSRKWGRETNLFVFKEALYKVKPSDLQFSFNIFW